MNDRSHHRWSRSCVCIHGQLTGRFSRQVVINSRLMACMAADATPGSLPCRSRLPGSRPGGPATTKRASFLDLLVSLPSSSRAPPQNGPRTVFLPGKEVFAHRDQRCLHSLQRHGTHPVSGHYPRGSWSVAAAGEGALLTPPSCTSVYAVNTAM
jgi:hypothetical protein